MPRVPVLVLALAVGFPQPGQALQAPAAACATAADCRVEADAAIAAGDFEHAHDLAWRAVQRGPKNDPGLMFLLARAQALSGRPGDALVMLRRIAELGVAPDPSGDEFRRTRAMSGWPAVEDVIARAAATSLPATPAPTAPAPRAVKEDAPAAVALPAPSAPSAPSAPVEPLEPVEPALSSLAGTFSSTAFAPGGLACDAVSGRFVFGDRPGRKLQIVAEGGAQSIDLTREASAGFLDVMALDIDTARGDLWVTSADPVGQAAILHKLQLVSGRVLASFEVPSPAARRPVDVTALRSGAVLVLDAAQRKVFVLRPRAAALEPLVDLGVRDAVSLTEGSRDDIVYVAGPDGLRRLDVRQKTISDVTGKAGLTLGGIERIDRHGAELVAVQVMPDGRRRLGRFALDAAGRSVTAVRVVDVALPSTDAPVLTAVCGDGVTLLTRATPESASLPAAWTFTRVRFSR